jgi:hypothetical protein
MGTLFVVIIVFLALVVLGLFLPILWIPAAVILIGGLIYVASLVRDSSRKAEREGGPDPRSTP